MTAAGTAGQRGSAGLLTILAAVALGVVGLALVAAASDVAVAAARARSAADAAALAAAAAAPLAGGDGDRHAAALHLATANGARLVSCCGVASPGVDRAAGPVAVVEVAVRPRLALLRGAAVHATAAAGLRPPDQAPCPTGQPGQVDGSAAHPGGADYRCV